VPQTTRRCRPDRWLDTAHQPSSFEYLSFNAGPRICLGKALAELEATYVLVGLLQRFSFELVAPSAPTYQLSMVMPAKGGMPMRVHRRAPAAAAAAAAMAMP
jgi:fatty acid omega-hydroxylase